MFLWPSMASPYCSCNRRNRKMDSEPNLILCLLVLEDLTGFGSYKKSRTHQAHLCILNHKLGCPTFRSQTKHCVGTSAILLIHQPARQGAPTKMIPVTAQALPFPYTMRLNTPELISNCRTVATIACITPANDGPICQNPSKCLVCGMNLLDALELILNCGTVTTIECITPAND